MSNKSVKRKQKEIFIDGEITFFIWDDYQEKWTATFTESEIKSFIKRAKQRAKKS